MPRVVRFEIPVDDPARAPDHPMVNSIDVPSVDDYLANVLAAGGTGVVPRFAVPTIGWLAYGKYSEGNVFGLWQSDPCAR
jgi:predicted enzyme related to lactoylglutathione lyase